jgi:hypothetical protein
MGGKNVFEIETVLLDVGHKEVDGPADIDKGRLFGFGIVQKITVRIDRPGHFVEDNEIS